MPLDPTTFNGTQCNEKARLVCYRALERCEKELAKNELDAENVSALAALIETCANDFDVSAA